MFRARLGFSAMINIILIDSFIYSAVAAGVVSGCGVTRGTRVGIGVGTAEPTATFDGTDL